MLYHPKTLKLLSNFKLGNASLPRRDLLALLLDNTVFVDLETLSHILFSHTPHEKNVDALVDRMRSQFRRYPVGTMWICFCTDIPFTVAELVLENRVSGLAAIMGAAECRQPGAGNSAGVRAITSITGPGHPRNLVMELEEASAAQIEDALSRLRTYQATASNEATLDKGSSGEDTPDAPASVFASSGSAPPADNSHPKHKAVDSAGGGELVERTMSPRPSIAIILPSKRDPPEFILSSQLDSVLRTSEADYSTENTRNYSKKLRKQRLCQSNTLQFTRVESDTPTESVSEKFSPLVDKSATFTYDGKHVTLDTQRKRDDLVNPVKLQFIKLHDQRRPPIYRKMDRMLRQMNSHQKLDEIIDYEDRSSDEWEPVDADGISCDSISYSGSSDGAVPSTEGSWIDKDSSDEEVQIRFNKKPTFNFEPVKTTEFFAPHEFVNANLKMSDELSPALRVDVARAKRDGLELEEISKLYNVEIGALKQILGASA